MKFSKIIAVAAILFLAASCGISNEMNSLNEDVYVDRKTSDDKDLWAISPVEEISAIPFMDNRVLSFLGLTHKEIVSEFGHGDIVQHEWGNGDIFRHEHLIYWLSYTDLSDEFMPQEHSKVDAVLCLFPDVFSINDIELIMNDDRFNFCCDLFEHSRSDCISGSYTFANDYLTLFIGTDDYGNIIKTSLVTIKSR